MGLFSKRSAAPAAAIPPRGIPPLYPAFYQAALRTAGKPDTAHNIEAVAQLTAVNLALNAHTWLDALQDSAARARFDAQFNPRANAARTVHVPDDMIDFLWAWTARAHPGLHDFVGQMSQTIVSSVSQHGDTLPADLWSANS